MYKKDRWMKLDNAAKVFPYISSKSFANVFRLSVNLKEKIKPDILQKAIDDMKNRFPMFFVKMKSGVFWYYYEQNDKKIKLKEESPFVCAFKNKSKNNGHLLEMFYFNTRFTIEVFHAVSDATGTLELLKSILYRYFELLGKDIKDEDNVIIHYGSSSRKLEMEDSFNKHYNPYPDKNEHRYKPEKAFKLKGEKFYALGNGIIVGKVDSNKLYEISKLYNCTVTQLLSAVLMDSIYKYMINHEKINKRPVTIVLPVNMRKYLESETLRNFSLYIYLSQKRKSNNMKLDDYIESIKQCYQNQLTTENLIATLNANMQLERNTFLKYCPLLFKLIAVKLGYNSIAGGLATASFSNLGILKGFEPFDGLIDDVEFIAGGTEYSYSVCACTYKDITSISFARTVVDTEIEKEFFRTLTSLGINVLIESNLWEEN